jgi:SAM-dependent methyltransferase
MKTFEKLINWMPKEFSVLDVGCGGLLGENTSSFLATHFKKVLGICWRPETNEDLRSFKTIFPNVEILHEDFFRKKFDQQFDLVVLDMNIESNLDHNWTNEGLRDLKKLVKPGGYLINYVMMTTEYGDAETSQLLARHRDEFWQSSEFSNRAIGAKLQTLTGWELVTHGQEERRPYIYWVLLKNE